MSSLYISLTDNIEFNRFTFGYGLNISKNTWSLRNPDYPESPIYTSKPVSKSGISLGASINFYHRLTEKLYIGLVYRPSFLNIHPSTKFRYEHVISLDFSLKLKLFSF